VLEPLCEIAPGYIHPVLKKSIRDLLLECKDGTGVVRKYSFLAGGRKRNKIPCKSKANQGHNKPLSAKL